MDVQHAIERGIGAARANNQPTAYYYFYAATQADPTNEQAWLWRASTAPQPRDALFCLAAVLAINPENPVARHGLEQISAAVAAESTPAAVTITPSLSSRDYKPPERRLEWQQAFQRSLYDMAQVPRMQRVATEPARDGAGSAAAEAGGLAYRRPPGIGRRISATIRRVFVNRETQRVQFAIPVVIAVVLLIGAVGILGWNQLNRPSGGVVPTPTADIPSTTVVAEGGSATPSAPGGTPASTTVALVATTTGVGQVPSPAVTAAAPTTAPPTTAPPTTAPPSGVPSAQSTATQAPPAPATAAPPTVPPTVPATSLPPTAPPAPSPTAALPAAATNTPGESGPQTVTVAGGQTLQQVADQQHVTFAALWAYNDLTSRDVTSGQTLKVPPAGYKPTSLRYIIRSGDNLTNIASVFGASIDAITLRNGLANPSAIDAGQLLTIPLP